MKYILLLLLISCGKIKVDSVNYPNLRLLKSETKLDDLNKRVWAEAVKLMR